MIKKSLCTWWLQYIIVRCTETFWSPCTISMIVVNLYKWRYMNLRSESNCDFYTLRFAQKYRILIYRVRLREWEWTCRSFILVKVWCCVCLMSQRYALAICDGNLPFIFNFRFVFKLDCLLVCYLCLIFLYNLLYSCHVTSWIYNWIYIYIYIYILKYCVGFFFHSRTVHLDIIKVLLPTDAQENCFKRSSNVNFNTPFKAVLLCISW